VFAVPVFVNVTVGFATVLLLKPVVGDHKYVFPATAAAPKLPEAPEQMDISAPAFEIGAVLAATTTVFVTAHNVVELVTVTVYVPEASAVAV
jgi:hypothetical protein